MAFTPTRFLVYLLVVGTTLGPVFGAVGVDGASITATADPEERASSLVELQAVPETDNTVTRIVVHENGTARWTLRIRTRLETDDAEGEYRAFQDRFRENTSPYLEDFRESITGIVTGAAEVTGRDMQANGFSASTSVQSIPRRWGVVTFEFRWDGFAETEGDRLVVGDVFEGGLFIAEGDSVEVVAPDGYRIRSADPAPDETAEGVVTWEGREDFADRRPRVVIAAAGSNETGSLPWQVIAGGAALLGLVTIGGVGYRRYRGRRGEGSAVDGGGDGARKSGSGAAGDPLLADEDYVLRALADSGGRMRQKAIAEELDWSRSKTSRVLGRMAEAGQVRKLQLGRENVIALPEETDPSGETDATDESDASGE